MSTTLDLIDLMPQNLLQPSVPFNKDMQVVAALLVPVMEDFMLTTPPTTVLADVGKCWIVPAGATGVWATHTDEIVLATAPTLWLFLVPPIGTRARVLNNNGVPLNVYYRYTGSAWVDDTAAGAITEAPNDAQKYVRQSEAWTVIVAGVFVDDGLAVDGQATTLLLGDGLVLVDMTGGAFLLSSPVRYPPIVTDATANLNADETNAGNYTRFSHALPTYTFDDAEPFVAGAEYHGRYVGAGTLTITAAGTMVINAPADGSLVIPPQGTFTVKIVSASVADLIGVTEAP
jgi:hypothetical protein